jgi:hypothetical protein
LLTGARSTTSADSAISYKESIMVSKRELIEPHKGDKRYVRRDDKGHFIKEVNVGRSLAADRRAHAKKTVKPGQGDRGDVKR